MTKEDDAGGSDNRWLAFVTNLPTDDPASRMRVMRMLESLGSAVLREGVFLLPDNPATRQSLTRLTEHVARLNGTSHLLLVTAQDDAQNLRFLSMFDRAQEYEALIQNVQSLRTGFGISDPSSISRVLAKQRRDFEEISALDFFPSPIQEQALETMRNAEREVLALMFPDAPKTVTAQSTASEFHKRTWATRTPLWTDRLASAWLIRRFIDTEARFLWLDKSQECPPAAIGFGFEGGTFSNSKSQVTFEGLLESFGLQQNAALMKVAAMIRHLDGTGPAVSEAAGVETLLEGARRRSGSEDGLLSECEKTFDLLFEAYSDANKNL